MNLTKKNKILYLVTLILVVGGDLFTKHLVSSSMLLGQSHEIINNLPMLITLELPGGCLLVN